MVTLGRHNNAHMIEESSGCYRWRFAKNAHGGSGPIRFGRVRCHREVVGTAADSIASLFEAADRGEKLARDALFTALYHELHRLALAHLHRNGGQITLSATTLLHEAYVGMTERTTLAFPSQNHFLSYASRAMRGLIIDYVRHKRAIKSGGELTFTTLDDVNAAATDESVDLEDLGRALDELATLDAPLAELVDLKFFCGLSFSEIAKIHGVSERTVQRDWAKARVLLHRAMNGRR
jgi:RNA polymerase sigma factor (TIGR02999 family)